MTSDLRPALLGSAVLHLSLLAAGLIAWPHFARPLPMSSVAVKLVMRAPVADIRPAVEALEPTPAAAPELAPEPPPEAVAAPPPPAPSPPTPAPAPPKPPSLDLDALASKLPKPKPPPKLDLAALASKPQSKLDLAALAAKLPKAANAPRGPARPEQAIEARAAAGAAQGLTADEASLLAAKLNRLWHPNCGAEGAADVQVKVNIRLTNAGGLAAPPAVVGPQPNNPVWQAAAQRALTAVAAGAPYDELPRDRYAVWKDINFNFIAREQCGAGR